QPCRRHARGRRQGVGAPRGDRLAPPTPGGAPARSPGLRPSDTGSPSGLFDFPEVGCYGQLHRKSLIYGAIMASKLHLITYGCQMNEYDSERVAGLLRERQYELTDDEREADVILLNTCAIREKAEEKVYSKLGEL